MKERILYKETYRPHAMSVKPDKVPKTLPFLNRGYEAMRIEIRAAGHCTLDGVEYEFQDVRVYAQPRVEK